jgi:hypothetical protein
MISIVKAKPQHVNKKCDCDEKRVLRETDGICYYFSCLECGTAFADLIVGAEP